MEDIYISSRTNPTVQLLASLQSKKGRRDAGLFPCEGKKLCTEAVGKCAVAYAVIMESRDCPDLRKIAEESGGSIIVLSDGAFEKITSDNTPDGIFFAVKMPENDEKIGKNEHIFALENVRDPGNVGTVIRTAAAFGADRVILAGSADAFSPKAVRASMGALFNIKVTVCTSLLQVIPQLKAQGRRIVSSALTDNSVTLGKCEILPSDCPVVGNEGHGISRETLEASDETLIIPMTDKTESLNAATAAAVLLWEYSKAFGMR